MSSLLKFGADMPTTMVTVGVHSLFAKSPRIRLLLLGAGLVASACGAPDQPTLSQPNLPQPTAAPTQLAMVEEPTSAPTATPVADSAAGPARCGADPDVDGVVIDTAVVDLDRDGGEDQVRLVAHRTDEIGWLTVRLSDGSKLNTALDPLTRNGPRTPHIQVVEVDGSNTGAWEILVDNLSDVEGSVFTLVQLRDCQLSVPALGPDGEPFLSTDPGYGWDCRIGPNGGKVLLTWWMDTLNFPIDDPDLEWEEATWRLNDGGWELLSLTDDTSGQPVPPTTTGNC